MDIALTQRAKDILAKHPRKMATLADVLAVIDRESHGVPTFRPGDRLYQSNLAAAHKITGIDVGTLRKTCTINYGALQGQISKFRCEPGYWDWAKGYLKIYKPEDAFLLSCSFGLGQKMARWLVSGTAPAAWLDAIRHFMGSVDQQIAYVCGDVDSLLVRSNADRALAFTRYNAGPSASPRAPAYQDYGIPVAAKAREIQELLKEMHL